MIVTTLMGGLGNQLFQYAAGRTLAMRTGRRLVLDATRLPSPAGGALRPYELGQLPIDPSARVVHRPGSGGRTRAPSLSALRVDHRLRRALRPWTVVDPEDEDVLVDLSSPPAPLALLFGYWQSHRYHVGAEEVLRRELTPAIPSSGRVNGVLRDANGRTTTTVHVRRGDYVSDARVAARLGAQAADHYIRAMEHVAERCEDPLFLVLSDDPAWAAQHLRVDAPIRHVESHAPLTAVEALALMSRSRHAILSNSSLSWWGARLAAHDAQMVIAPAVWFAGREADLDHRLPSKWIAVR